ncbi:MAG TPA: hypothetical protein PK397_05915 [Ignavibacteriaceae bacterium]|jgi:hypothetical protein|nr:hypothetical protein [Ignavibacteriaceae bacterium]
MDTAFERIMDAIDIETYIVCSDANEGKKYAMQLGREMNLGEIDIMYQEFDGYGIRVRLRKYIYKPGNNYTYLNKEKIS